MSAIKKTNNRRINQVRPTLQPALPFLNALGPQPKAKTSFPPYARPARSDIWANAIFV
jgi:hypothetical protein